MTLRWLTQGSARAAADRAAFEAVCADLRLAVHIIITIVNILGPLYMLLFYRSTRLHMDAVGPASDDWRLPLLLWRWLLRVHRRVRGLLNDGLAHKAPFDRGLGIGQCNHRGQRGRREEGMMTAMASPMSKAPSGGVDRPKVPCRRTGGRAPTSACRCPRRSLHWLLSVQGALLHQICEDDQPRRLVLSLSNTTSQRPYYQSLRPSWRPSLSIGFLPLSMA